ncbi:MAG TPA: toxin HicA [Geobacter sp.]|nr:toxin HicA [Geobacter sp.]
MCDHYFGPPRQASGSHRVYPWSGDPRVNIQNAKGQAKAYQVRQVLKAIERLEVEHISVASSWFVSRLTFTGS